MEDYEILKNICSQPTNLVKLSLSYNIDQTSLNDILQSIVRTVSQMLKRQSDRIDQVTAMLTSQVEQYRQENNMKWATFRNSLSTDEIVNTYPIYSVRNIQYQNITESNTPYRQEISTSTDKKMGQHSTVNIVRLPAQKDKNPYLSLIEYRLKKVESLASKPKENIKRTSLVSREALTDKKLEIVRGVMLTETGHTNQNNKSNPVHPSSVSVHVPVSMPAVPVMSSMPGPSVLPSIRQQISQYIQSSIDNITSSLSESIHNLSLEQTLLNEKQQSTVTDLEKLRETMERQAKELEESNKQWKLYMELRMEQQQVATQNQNYQLYNSVNYRLSYLGQQIKELSKELSAEASSGTEIPMNVGSTTATRISSHKKLHTYGSENPQKKRDSSVQRANNRVEVLYFHLNTVREQVKGVKDEVATVRRTCDRISTKHSEPRETSSRGFLPKLYKIYETRENKENQSQNAYFPKQLAELNGKISDLAEGIARLSVKIRKIEENHSKFHEYFLEMYRKMTNNAASASEIDTERLRNQILEILNRCLTDPFDNQFTQHLRKYINSRFIEIKHEYKDILRDVDKKVEGRADIQQLSRLADEIKGTFETMKALLAKKQDTDYARQNNKFMEVRLKELTSRLDKKGLEQPSRDCSFSIYSRK